MDDTLLGSVQMSDIWSKYWNDGLPVAERLRAVYGNRWLRFHTLPSSKRYAETQEEERTILDRHNQLLNFLNPQGHLLTILPEWSMKHEPPVAESVKVAQFTKAVHFWKSIDERKINDYSEGYRHLYLTSISQKDVAIDRLLMAVAGDEVSGVIFAPERLSWLYCPYDGGVDIFFTDETQKKETRLKFSDWYAAI